MELKPFPKKKTKTKTSNIKNQNNNNKTKNKIFKYKICDQSKFLYIKFQISILLQMGNAILVKTCSLTNLNFNHVKIQKFREQEHFLS